MYRLFTTILFVFFMQLLSAQTPGEWVWMNGANSFNSPGLTGVLGVEDSLNQPQSVYMPVSWQDTSGNFWIYGGHRLNMAYSDLYRYNLSTNNWTWMNGTGQASQTPQYGVQGVAAAGNTPGMVRFGAATWTGPDNNLWLYAGYSSPPNPLKADLWKYDLVTNMWTWMKGNQQNSFAGSYGVQGVSDSTNLPPGKDFCQAAWVDASGNLWQFGGEIKGGSIDDVWKYDLQTNDWTWMKGSDSCCAPAVYGTKGVEDPANTPGARKALMHWKDQQGMFWIFGDEGRTSDLWRFNPLTNNWAWMGGAAGTFNAGNYGVQCTPDTANLPPGRVFSASSWTDANGDLWMLGGQFFGSADKSNDLWKYDIAGENWMWVSGSSTVGSSGNYGTKGISSAMNEIPARTGSVGWADPQGNFWIFGGYNVNTDAFNDLWRFTPDTTCGGIVTGIEEPSASALVIYTANDQLLLSFPLNASHQYQICNLSGQVLFADKLSRSEQILSLPLESFVNGIYIAQAVDENGKSYVRKFAVFR